MQTRGSLLFSKRSDLPQFLESQQFLFYLKNFCRDSWKILKGISRVFDRLDRLRPSDRQKRVFVAILEILKYLRSFNTKDLTEMYFYRSKLCSLCSGNGLRCSFNLPRYLSACNITQSFSRRWTFASLGIVCWSCVHPHSNKSRTKGA